MNCALQLMTRPEDIPNLVFVRHSSFRETIDDEIFENRLKQFDTIIVYDAGLFAEYMPGCCVFSPWIDIFHAFSKDVKKLGLERKKMVFITLCENPVSVYPQVAMPFIEVGVPSHLSNFVQRNDRTDRQPIDSYDIEVSGTFLNLVTVLTSCNAHQQNGPLNVSDCINNCCG